MNSHFKAVLWDFGGVITTSPFEAFNRYEVAHGIPRDFIRGVNATDPETNAWAQFESSQIAAEQFDHAFEVETRRAGFAIPGKIVIDMLSGDVRPRMIDVLKICKQHYRVVCITNNVKARQGSGLARSADKAACVQAAMALFLDDLGINLKSARALGMTTIKVISEQQAVEELANILDLSF